ncbi:hypothetical protein D3C81_1183580 [compost metagenome]
MTRHVRDRGEHLAAGEDRTDPWVLRDQHVGGERHGALIQLPADKVVPAEIDHHLGMQDRVLWQLGRKRQMPLEVFAADQIVPIQRAGMDAARLRETKVPRKR